MSETLDALLESKNIAYSKYINTRKVWRIIYDKDFKIIDLFESTGETYSIHKVVGDSAVKCKTEIDSKNLICTTQEVEESLIELEKAVSLENE